MDNKKYYFTLYFICLVRIAILIVAFASLYVHFSSIKMIIKSPKIYIYI